MDLRLPVIATIVAAAGAVAGVRALRHDAAAGPSPDGVAASFSSPPPPAERSAFRPRRDSGRPAATRITVYVAGEVARPGVFALAPTARAVDALRAAGGARADADLIAVNLAEPLADGEEIAVPAKGAAPAEALPARSGSPHHARKRRRKHRAHRRARATESGGEATGTAAAAAVGARGSADPPGSADARPGDGEPPAGVVDLNRADENELETLPGIGASLAERIVAFRELNGPFASADDLLDVGGMTQSRLDAIAPYVTTR